MGATVDVRVIDDPTRLLSGCAVAAVGSDGRRIVFTTPTTPPADLLALIDHAATAPLPGER